MNRLDSGMVDRFRRDGFLPFDTGLPASEIAALRRTLAGLHAENVGFKEGALFDGRG